MVGLRGAGGSLQQIPAHGGWQDGGFRVIPTDTQGETYERGFCGLFGQAQVQDRVATSAVQDTTSKSMHSMACKSST